MGMITLHNTNAENWVFEHKHQPSYVTSIPDVGETPYTITEWKKWFYSMAEAIIEKTQPNGYAIFYQTDRKIDGTLIDKSYIINKAAEKTGAKVIWHKIAMKRSPYKADIMRPTYTHLICISKEGVSGKATPDIFYAGKMMYKNAMGLQACQVAIDFLKSKGITKVVDPFCGQGSVLVVAGKNKMEAIGIDIDKEQIKRAKLLLEKNLISLQTVNGG